MLFKDSHASAWTELDVARVNRQAKQAYENRQFEKAQAFINLVLDAQPGNIDALLLQSRIKASDFAVLEWPDENEAWTAAPKPTATPVRPTTVQTTPSKTRFVMPIMLVIAVALTGAIVLQERTHVVPKLEPMSVAKREVPKPMPMPTPEPVSRPVVSTEPVTVVTTPSAPAAKPPVLPVAPNPIAVNENGKLSVSSRSAADIYLDDKYLGSTPATIDLPVGPHTLEYRHGDLRKTITHNIVAGVTTTAMIGFEVTVQINARPWAQVFVDGDERRALGQTPLGEVRVPVGANLVFEHPNYNKKTYRVTGKETAIQVVFP